MKSALRKKAVIAGATAAVIILIAGISAAVLNGRTGFLTNAVGVVSSPLRNGVNSAANWLEGIYAYMYDYDRLKAENVSLKSELSDMEALIRDSEAMREENERMRDLLGFQQKHTDFEFEPAAVVSFTSSNWSSSFTVNKGSASGLQLRQCVVTEDGELVGVIVELGTNWATVMTVIDTEFSVGATLSESGGSAIAEGDFTLMQEGCLKLDYLAEGTLLVTGDTILTSGVGGVYPRGLVIGKITDVRSDLSELSRYAVIAPSARLDSLTQVFAIKSFSITD